MGWVNLEYSQPELTRFPRFALSSVNHPQVDKRALVIGGFLEYLPIDLGGLIDQSVAL
jgi:hypothetical protein